MDFQDYATRNNFPGRAGLSPRSRMRKIILLSGDHWRSRLPSSEHPSGMEPIAETEEETRMISGMLSAPGRKLINWSDTSSPARRATQTSPLIRRSIGSQCDLLMGETHQQVMVNPE